MEQIKGLLLLLKIKKTDNIVIITDENVS